MNTHIEELSQKLNKAKAELYTLYSPHNNWEFMAYAREQTRLENEVSRLHLKLNQARQRANRIR